MKRGPRNAGVEITERKGVLLQELYKALEANIGIVLSCRHPAADEKYLKELIADSKDERLAVLRVKRNQAAADEVWIYKERLDGT